MANGDVSVSPVQQESLVLLKDLIAQTEGQKTRQLQWSIAQQQAALQGKRLDLQKTAMEQGFTQQQQQMLQRREMQGEAQEADARMQRERLDAQSSIADKAYERQIGLEDLAHKRALEQLRMEGQTGLAVLEAMEEQESKTAQRMSEIMELQVTAEKEGAQAKRKYDEFLSATSSQIESQRGLLETMTAIAGDTAEGIVNRGLLSYSSIMTRPSPRGWDDVLGLSIADATGNTTPIAAVMTAIEEAGAMDYLTGSGIRAATAARRTDQVVQEAAANGAPTEVLKALKSNLEVSLQAEPGEWTNSGTQLFKSTRGVRPITKAEAFKSAKMLLTLEADGVLDAFQRDGADHPMSRTDVRFIFRTAVDLADPSVEVSPETKARFRKMLMTGDGMMAMQYVKTLSDMGLQMGRQITSVIGQGEEGLANLAAQQAVSSLLANNPDATAAEVQAAQEASRDVFEGAGTEASEASLAGLSRVIEAISSVPLAVGEEVGVKVPGASQLSGAMRALAQAFKTAGVEDGVGWEEMVYKVTRQQNLDPSVVEGMVESLRPYAEGVEEAAEGMRSQEDELRRLLLESETLQRRGETTVKRIGAERGLEELDRLLEETGGTR
jgi:hypothetical protein